MKKIIILLTISLMLIPSVLEAETSEELINRIAPNEVLEVTTRKPKSLYSAKNLVYRTLTPYNSNEYYIMSDCSEISKCSISIINKETGNKEIENKEITINYKEILSKEIYDKAETIMNKLKTLKPGELYYDVSVDSNYILSDLPLINMISNGYGDIDLSDYIPELNEIFKDDKYKIGAYYGAGEKGTLTAMPDGTGGEPLYYDNNEFPIAILDGFSIIYYHMIYISEDTPNTTEAYIEAATKRIKERFPNIELEITHREDLPALTNSANDKDMYEWSTNRGYKGGIRRIFDFKINDSYFRFGIIANNDYIEVPSYEKVEKETGITISTLIGNIPADTMINVEDLTNIKEEIEKVKEKITTTIHKIFDISLYSETKGENITKLETGMFKVTIPLGEDYMGKYLSAYYIKENGELEEHEITLDEEGNATFETDHFSTYVIAESSKIPETPYKPELPAEIIEVPNTIDNIAVYFNLLIFSLLSLIGITYIKSRM